MRASDVAIDRSLRVDDFAYDLPEELIAQAPLARRDASRLLVLDRPSGGLEHATVADLPDLLDPGDLLVANNSRVIPARLAARKRDTGGRVELLLLRDEGEGVWTALAKPARRLAAGTALVVEPRAGASAPPLGVEVLECGDGGQVRVAVDATGPEPLAPYGTAPLPPYVRSALAEPERYQTVYAAEAGSAAAPTAGLHFGHDLLDALRRRGVGWAEVTLHVGLDTFRPVTTELVADHPIHREWCEVPASTARAVLATRGAGRRVIAVGTTAVRTLETLASDGLETAAVSGMKMETGLFILPGYRWKLVDAMITNFHLPRSTLLMMVSAFAGREAVRRAYAVAIEERYRFFSFGDAMLIR
ncbi:MAG: S-adenosylmethionine:tRNA ribosyltransferase-isomerase [uncultured Thermomicrobiales bacterium]|uniref:S-adenosylmethionine:tRNA ribosyltransferase-isomerase n=1 Tax=uncultured Thermomicrobiales bacterium TaxID=1645740 RepID=A0A6J4U769_9BACT|nr:MAG: S-adenosylmethionine:tRNA ribosyltransferase-isomerase [uncultured Thermomicrobiales bacterium]